MTVWITFTVAMAVLAIMLVIVQRVENNIHSNHDTHESFLWSDAVLDTIAVVCQQGTASLILGLLRQILFLF